MLFKKILQLTEDPADGKFNIKEGAIGSNGYGFVFRDENFMSNYLQVSYSSKFHCLGSMRRFANRYEKEGTFTLSNGSLEDTEEYDMKLIGAVKTLVPTIKTGGAEWLFGVWLFTVTPNGLRFPMNLYYGPTRLGLGGWDYEGKKSLLKNLKNITEPKDYPLELQKIVNYNPFELSRNDKEELAEALELALRQVPISDFYGFYANDNGYLIMGIRNKKPFVEYITTEYTPTLHDIKCLSLGLDEAEADKLYSEIISSIENHWS